MSVRWKQTLGLSVLSGVLMLSGCEAGRELSDALQLKTGPSRFLAPEQVIDSAYFDRKPINPILTSVGMVDDVGELPPGATFPRPGDWSYVEEDYRVGPADLLEIGVLGLFQAGAEAVVRRQVTESGFVDLPMLPEPVYVRGKDVAGVRRAIADAYDPQILRDPIVSVTILQRRQNTFSILGSVDRPGTYNILRNDMRLMEALAMGGGVVTRNIDYIYVIRPAPAEAIPPDPEDPEAPAEPAPSPREQIEESLEQPTEQPPAVPETEDDLEDILREHGGAVPEPTHEDESEPPRPADRSSPPRISDAGGASAATDGSNPDSEPEHEWIFRDGRWQRVPLTPEEPDVDEPEVDEPAPEEPDPEDMAPPERRPPLEEMPEAEPPPEVREDPFGWAELEKIDDSRIIAINLRALNEGDPQMNIVIRPNDVVYVPILDSAEFYVTGEVARPGPYNMTGRKVTVKQALAYAGGMSPLAWPENAILIRRVGGSQEQIIPLDLEAIFQGEEPDLFLKADDVIAVGSSWRSPFYLVMRNAFRMTYGFGFIYDRNFANPVFTTPTSRRFTRW